ncbi:hypothetical protein AAG570_002078 [Ranatra chinensis]|uniref:Uncharacterized protein n=1 Tax=Ranatra chinensis TaxID=642074 RepID=A0ABD0YAE1_9HEMI
MVGTCVVAQVGLCKILQEQHWTRKVGEQLVLYPRTFEVHSQDDLRHFVKKYRITACLALVPLDVVDFAVARLCEYVNFKESADLDVWDSSLVPQEEWTNFQEAYYSIVNETEQFNIGSIECVPIGETLTPELAGGVTLVLSGQVRTGSDINRRLRPPRYSSHVAPMFIRALTYILLIKLVEACKKCVEAMKVYWPHMNMEGYRNVWIVKPGASNRGRGIVLENTLQGITNYCKNRNHYVIQKYIEKPLLVYSTKFDIRQWFLVTSVFPLTIWMYNQCYLRFSSQLFSLVNLDESVHLCNHSIQHKYKNCVRNSNLPNDNMWDDLQFVQYLSSQGQGEKWSSVVVPQMQDAIVGAVLASQDRMTHRPNSFSLYGADFLLSEDFSVWLLEINSQPDMGHTSKITARMCPEVLEDVCKVVVDRREDERASPGKFRLILRQKVSTNSGAASTANIMLSGKRMRIEKSGEYGPPLKSLQTNKDIDQPNKLKSLRTTNENSSLWRSIKYEKLAVYKNKSMKESTVREKPWLVTEGYSGRRPLEPGDATVPLPPKLPESPSSNVSPTVQFLEEKSSEDLSTRLQNALNQLTF